MAGKRGGRRHPPLILTAEDEAALKRYARGRTVSQALAVRARIVLRCATGEMHRDIASALGVDGDTVGKWRRRFVMKGMAGLSDSARPNVHRKLADERVEEVVRLTLESLPKGSTHWSTRKLAKKSGVSQSSVSRVWRAFQLKPHRHRTFTLSTDDFFVEKVRDVVGLYMNPPDHAVVLCLDEKSQIQALERSQPVLPLVFGQPVRATATYSRHGTTNLFAALNIATGKVIGECFPRKRAAEFVRFLRRVDEEIPEPLQAHLVVDNSSIHNTPSVRRWLRRHPRFHVHFTPTYSSWLNLIERWFANLTEDALRRSTHLNTRELREAIERYIGETNDGPKPFVWTKTADQILASVARFCARTIQQAE
ncbi:MAG: IS630 family transposase [Gemmatimonadales bacterium]